MSPKVKLSRDERGKTGGEKGLKKLHHILGLKTKGGNLPPGTTPPKRAAGKKKHRGGRKRTRGTSLRPGGFKKKASPLFHRVSRGSNRKGWGVTRRVGQHAKEPPERFQKN